MAKPHGYGPLYPDVEGIGADGDGTLYDTERLQFELYVDMLHARGHAYAEADHHRIVGRAGLEVARIIVGMFRLDEEPADFLEECRRLGPPRMRQAPLMPGVERWFETCRKIGAPRAFVSSAHDAHAFAMLDTLDLRRRFKCIITADTPGIDGLRKPDPRPYRLAAEKLRARRGRCFTFEDTRVGAISACEAGWIVVGVPHRFSPRETLEGIAHYVMPEGQNIGDFQMDAIAQWFL